MQGLSWTLIWLKNTLTVKLLYDPATPLFGIHHRSWQLFTATALLDWHNSLLHSKFHPYTTDRYNYTSHQKSLFKENGNSHWTQHRWCTGSPDITTPVKEGQEDCKIQNPTRKTTVNQSLLEVAAQIKPSNDNTNKHANMEEGNFQRTEHTPDKELQETMTAERGRISLSQQWI